MGRAGGMHGVQNWDPARFFASCQRAARGRGARYARVIFKTACTEIGGRSGRRPDMTFLDFWSTSSALYEPDESSKDAGAALEVDQKSRKVISVLRPDPPPISVHAVFKTNIT